jgi:hypothetical protein
MAYATVGDLIKAFREDEKDTVAPYFWSDNQLLRWTNEALSEFAERTMSIYDDESPITLIPYGIGDDRFVLDACIIDVVGVWIEGPPRRQLLRSSSSFQHGYGRGYGCESGGSSHRYHFDGAGQLRIHPKPIAADALRLRVVRRPVRDLDKCDKVPDLLPQDVRHLLRYICYKAYRVNDAETFNKASSDEHLQNFESACQIVCEQAILRRGDCARPIRSNW